MTKLLFILFIFTQLTAISQTDDIMLRWSKTDELIRDNKIDKDDAIDSISYYTETIVSRLKASGFVMTKKSGWHYPITKWTSVVYRANGMDYKDERFDFFQGGEYKGHPAHDIFILDADSNGVEDSTGQKIEAVSMVNGIVISVYGNWKPGDFLRSGNYVKIFDPKSQAIFYYSHLDSVFVGPGDVVKAGDPVAYVGRTGRKAFRGKTHLHIAYYKIDDGYPVPKDILTEILLAEKRYQQR